MKVFAKFVGGQTQEVTASTVGEVKTAMNASKSTATVDGAVRDNSYTLTEGAYVVLSEQVKGNMAKVIAKSSCLGLVITREGKHKKFAVNGTPMTEKQVEKVCLKVLAELGYNIA